jgi:photosystem II stability/assembly factor-like uncharacterized protein
VHTSDGGKTWVQQKSGVRYTLTSVVFVDAQTGWVVGDVGTILHTTDGGTTWEKQESPVNFFLMGACFISPQKGWIVTERTHILSTEDGGKTWKVAFKDQDYILKAISFCDPLHGWAVGEYGYTYYTKDGGATWEKQCGFCTVSPETGELIGGQYLFDVAAFDPKTAWAAGIDGYVTRTVDGGATWEAVKTGAPMTQLFCLASDRKETIMIGGKGVFLSTHDGGRAWKVPDFTPPVDYGWLYGIAQRGSKGFVAVGWRGAIYLSSSQGWHRVGY